MTRKELTEAIRLFLEEQRETLGDEWKSEIYSMGFANSLLEKALEELKK
jgi:hypothetical protein